MARDADDGDKIQCLECGKVFDFLAPHLRSTHHMTLNAYRERWRLPRQVALASRSHRERCRQNVLVRIRNGDICPAEQIRRMHAADKTSPKNTATLLTRERASETARTKHIWTLSPVIKTAPAALKGEAVARMRARPVSHERVADIAAALGVAVSSLYVWLSQAKPP